MNLHTVFPRINARGVYKILGVILGAFIRGGRLLKNNAKMVNKFLFFRNKNLGSQGFVQIFRKGPSIYPPGGQKHDGRTRVGSLFEDKIFKRLEGGGRLIEGGVYSRGAFIKKSL